MLKIWWNQNLLKLKPHNSESPCANLPNFKQLKEHEAVQKSWKFRTKCLKHTPSRGVYIPKLRKIPVKATKIFVLEAPRPTPAPMSVKFGVEQWTSLSPRQISLPSVRGEKTQWSDLNSLPLLCASRNAGGTIIRPIVNYWKHDSLLLRREYSQRSKKLMLIALSNSHS